MRASARGLRRLFDGGRRWICTNVSRRQASGTRSCGPIGAADPYAELKNHVHLLVIGDLGPQLFNVSIDQATLRERVVADVRRHLTQESGLSRAERDQITSELDDDILGHGPLERLLADDTVSEIMVNGPFDIWVEREGRLYQTTVRFPDDSHLRRILNKIVAQVGRRVDESSAMVDARLPGRQPHQRDHPAALAQRARS